VATLHVVLAATHTFDNDLVDTVVQVPRPLLPPMSEPREVAECQWAMLVAQEQCLSWILGSNENHAAHCIFRFATPPKGGPAVAHAMKARNEGAGPRLPSSFPDSVPLQPPECCMSGRRVCCLERDNSEWTVLCRCWVWMYLTRDVV
jgi:hypothetical protein